MPRPAALLLALLATVAAAQQSVNMGFGKPPKNQRPAGPVKPNENFPWKDPDRKSTRLNSSHSGESRMPSSA